MNGDIGIGKLIEQERHRDAIHIAVCPVEAGVELRPGTEIGIMKGQAFNALPGLIQPIGVVDPFLKHVVLPGQRFYMFLFPGSITSLRHEWEHPTLGEVKATPTAPSPDKATSEKWLREYARRVNSYYCGDGYYGEKDGGKDTSYEVLMADLAGNSITYHGIDMHDRGDLIDEKKLAHHASVVLGRPVNFDGFEYFSCSC